MERIIKQWNEIYLKLVNELIFRMIRNAKKMKFTLLLNRARLNSCFSLHPYLHIDSQTIKILSYRCHILANLAKNP